MKIQCCIPVYTRNGVRYVTFEDVSNQTGISRHTLGDYAFLIETSPNPFSFFPVDELQKILDFSTLTYTRKNFEYWESVLPIAVRNFNYAIQFFLAFATKQEKQDYIKGDYILKSSRFGHAYLLNAYIQVEKNLFFNIVEEFREMIDAAMLEKEMDFRIEDWLCDLKESRKVAKFSRASNWSFKELIVWKKKKIVAMHYLVAIMFCSWVDPNLGAYLSDTFRDDIRSIYEPDK